jgi:hypothetical protein
MGRPGWWGRTGWGGGMLKGTSTALCCAALAARRWFKANEAYAVPYRPRFEPWVLCSRTEVPW